MVAVFWLDCFGSSLCSIYMRELIHFYLSLISWSISIISSISFNTVKSSIETSESPKRMLSTEDLVRVRPVFVLLEKSSFLSESIIFIADELNFKRRVGCL